MKKIFLSIFCLFILLGCGESQSDMDVIDEEINLEDDNQLIEIDENLSELIETITFSEREVLDMERDVNETISIEKAFQFMVSLIADVTEIEVTDLHIELAYEYNHHVSRSSWNGAVFRDISHAELGFETWDETTMPLLFIELDALTGHGRSIHNLSRNSAGPFDDVTWGEVHDMTDQELSELFPILTEAEISDALDVASNIANRFFQVSDIVDISFGFFDGEPIELETFVGGSLPFTATNEQGQLIEIFLLRSVNELSVLHTPFTDEEIAPLRSN